MTAGYGARMPPTVVATTLSPDLSPATYRPAAVSRFLAWADSLPAHGWWLYPALVLGLVAYGHAVLWLSGGVPFGTIVWAAIIGVPYGPFALATLAYLNRVAERAIAAFWPATGWPDGERAGFARRFVTTPSGYGWACLGLGAVLAVGSFLQSPPGSLAPADVNPAAVFVAFLPSLLLGYSMLPAGVVQITRQLRLVDRIHREAGAIDPFDRVPVYAFSAFTARAGLIFLVIAYYS